MAYERQKTWEAVGSLIADRPIRERLEYAGQPLLVLRSHLEQREQEDLLQQVDGINARLASGSDLKAGAAALSDEEARKLADEILNLMVNAFGGL